MFDAVFILDVSMGKIVYANQAMCAMYGYSHSEALQLTIPELSFGEPHESLTVAMDSLSIAAQGSAQIFNWKARKKDGTLFWAETSMHKAGVAGKDLVIALVRDITNRKRMEEELQHARDELEKRVLERTAELAETAEALRFTQFAIDRTMDQAFWMTEDGQLFYVNDAACRTLGYTREELTKMSIPDIGPTFSPEVFAEHWRNLQKNGYATFESWHRAKDGRVYPVEIRANYVVFDGKEYNCAFATDITERKEAEVALRESRAKYQAIVDAFDGFIYICSQDYHIEFMNRKLIDRTGYDAVGELCYKVLHDRDSVCPWCINDRVFAGETVRWDLFSPKDKRWYHVVNVPIRHADGSMSKHSMIIDINDRKLFEEELQRQKQMLEELNDTLEKRVGEEVAKNREKDFMLIQQNRQAALGEMLDHIAHQWKQPLNSISLIIQDLGETASDGELTDEHVEETACKIMALLDHMAQTIDIFRGFYRPDKEKKVFSIKDCIDQALAFIAPAFRFHSIAVELDVDPGLTAFGYPKEYAQVLLNILANSRDAFKARGTEKPRVIIRAFAEDTKTVVTIADNAGGIPEAITGKIFDFYFTTNESSGGTGIGLYMSKNIIEKNMGGKLSAVNTGSGAQFRIEVKLS
jgi:PAS domain S-box-containing protein